MEPAPPDTLIVRRMPEALTEADLNELFQHFGAQSAKRQLLRGKKRRSNVLVKFPTHEDATLALIRLHQLVVMGKRLIVEYANFTFLPPPKLPAPAQNDRDENPWEYRPANKKIASDIASHLFRNETFYLRVLQLMKQMGLESPFSEQQPEQEALEAASEITCDTPIEEVEMEELYKEETEESELESDSEAPHKAETIPELPKRQKKLKLKRLDRLKAIKVTKIAAQPVAKRDETQTVSDVFEQQRPIQTEKKLLLRIGTEGSSIEPIAATSTEIVEGFGVFKPAATDNIPELIEDQTPVSTCTKDDFVTEQTLQINRLTEEEKQNLPVFKGYSPGVPNSRLYIKNIAKTVKDEDLKSIFGRYVNWDSEEERNMFDIRLMTEGRMKGQAFITLPSVQRAEKALAETNGFVLHGKPFVVQFARAAVSKQNTA